MEFVLRVCSAKPQVLRRDSVLDLLAAIRTAANYRDEATRRVVGTVVMTPYNNRTYRVDDIDWNKSPTSTFMLDGKPKTYVNYFQVGSPRVRNAERVYHLARGREYGIFAD